MPVLLTVQISVRNYATVLILSLLLCNFFGVYSESYAAGWVLAEDGETWDYHLSDTPSKLSSDFHKGWLTDISDGFTYYLNPITGHMQSGLVKINGTTHLFRDTRNMGNYVKGGSGFYRYVANGRNTYGSYVMTLGRQDPDHVDTHYHKSSSSDVTSDRASPSDYEDEDRDDPSDGDEHSSRPIASPSSPSEAETRPGVPEDETPRHQPCISDASWALMREDPHQFETCIEEGCLRHVMLYGEEVVIPSDVLALSIADYKAAISESREDVSYPFDVAAVSVLDLGSDGEALQFSMVAPNSDLSLPMLDSMGEADISSVYGFMGSFIFQVLYGSGKAGCLYPICVEDPELAGTYAHVSRRYGGLRLVESSPSRSSAIVDIPTRSLKMSYPLGAAEESRKENFYRNWLSNPSKYNRFISTLITSVNLPYYMYSEYGLTGGNDFSMLMPDGSVYVDYEMTDADLAWDGSDFWSSSYVTPLEDHDEELIGMFLSADGGACTPTDGETRLPVRIGFLV